MVQLFILSVQVEKLCKLKQIILKHRKNKLIWLQNKICCVNIIIRFGGKIMANKTIDKVKELIATQLSVNDEKVTDIKDNSKLKTIFQDENELIKITNSLGNLVAIVSGAKNSHLSNKSYAIKLKQYKIGTAREQEIAGKYKYWTIKEIYDRTNSMLDFIYKQWFIGYISEEDFNSQKDKMINWTYDDTLNPHSTLADLLDDLYEKELELHKEEKQRQEKEEEIKNSLFEFIVQNKQHPIIDELKDSTACKKLFNKKAVVLKEIELDKIKGEFKNKQKSEYRDYCLNLDKKIEINNHYYVLLDDWKDKIDVLKDLLKTLNQ
jgi:hypothetical protein